MEAFYSAPRLMNAPGETAAPFGMSTTGDTRRGIGYHDRRGASNSARSIQNIRPVANKSLSNANRAGEAGTDQARRARPQVHVRPSGSPPPRPGPKAGSVNVRPIDRATGLAQRRRRRRSGPSGPSGHASSGPVEAPGKMWRRGDGHTEGRLSPPERPGSDESDRSCGSTVEIERRRVRAVRGDIGRRFAAHRKIARRDRAARQMSMQSVGICVSPSPHALPSAFSGALRQIWLVAATVAPAPARAAISPQGAPASKSQNFAVCNACQRTRRRRHDDLDVAIGPKSGGREPV